MRKNTFIITETHLFSLIFAFGAENNSHIATLCLNVQETLHYQKDGRIEAKFLLHFKHYYVRAFTIFFTVRADFILKYLFAQFFNKVM